MNQEMDTFSDKGILYALRRELGWPQYRLIMRGDQPEARHVLVIGREGGEG
jgi:hypothetical protein